MLTSQINMFRKSASCPSSDSLLGYQGRSIRLDERTRIETHLTFCDFCNAELQLLARFQRNTETSVPVEMPTELRRMAERLLSRITNEHWSNGFLQAVRLSH
jgi:hypothetical protein